MYTRFRFSSSVRTCILCILFRICTPWSKFFFFFSSAYFVLRVCTCWCPYISQLLCRGHAAYKFAQNFRSLRLCYSVPQTYIRFFALTSRKITRLHVFFFRNFSHYLFRSRRMPAETLAAIFIVISICTFPLCSLSFAFLVLWLVLVFWQSRLQPNGWAGWDAAVVGPLVIRQPSIVLIFIYMLFKFNYAWSFYFLLRVNNCGVRRVVVSAKWIF